MAKTYNNLYGLNSTGLDLQFMVLGVDLIWHIIYLPKKYLKMRL